MANFDNLTKNLIIATAEHLLKRVENKKNVALRTAVYKGLTKDGRDVQVQISVTDVDFLPDFTTEEMKHCSYKDFKEKN